jgi:dipeptidyl aminopeptidase/acylaminoacyl peptidase
MKKVFGSILITLSLTVSAQQPLSVEQLLNFKKVGNPSLSADGEAMVFYIETTNIEKNKGNKDLYLSYTNNKDIEPVQLTNTTDYNEFAPQFNKTGSHVYFISTESGAPQVWVMNINTKEKIQVSSVSDGIGSFVMSSDEATLYYTADVKMDKSVAEIYPDAAKSNARIIDDLMYRHWDSWDDYSYTHLFFVSVSNYKAAVSPTDILKDEPFDVENFDVSISGKEVAYACKRLKGKEYALSTNTEIYYYDIQAKQTRNLSQGNLGYDMNPKFSHSGKYLIWESMIKAGFESDKANIVLFDFGTVKSSFLTNDFAEGASNLTWSLDDKDIYFIAPTKGTYQIYDLELSTKKITSITSGDHDCKSISLGAKSIIFAKTTMMRPQEIYKYSFASSKETQLTFVNNKILDKIASSKVEKRMVKTTDGKDMLVWIILPPDFDPAKKYPTLLYCQGGPQSMVSCSYSFRWNFALMAANGYVVVAPNRRGLPGFGREWNDAISGDWGGQPMKDYLSAIDDAKTLPYVDGNRLGAVGASYGGYSVYWLAGNHNKRFKSFISHCGLYNLESWYPSTEEMFFAKNDIGGAHWQPEMADAYSKFSPHNFVKKWDTPIMVIHGEKDFRVPVSEGMQAFGSAQLQNIKSRFLYFPDEGHWVLKPQNALVWHREFFRWLKETL